MNNNVTIFDLDNCLADDGWRIALIDQFEDDNWKKYLRYHLMSPCDEPANVERLPPHPQRVAIFTARPVFFFAQTRDWLRRVGIEHNWLLMRNNDDLRGALAVKRTQLAWFTSGDYEEVSITNIVRAYDDREDIVEMYRAQGIEAEVLRAHNEQYPAMLRTGHSKSSVRTKEH